MMLCRLRTLRMCVVPLALVCASLAAAPSFAAETVIAIASRGQKIPALLLQPDQPSKTAVILFAGGLGRLDIASNGTIGQLRGNQLVRTRDLYRRAGLLTLVPDLAPDMKRGCPASCNVIAARKPTRTTWGRWSLTCAGRAPRGWLRSAPAAARCRSPTACHALWASRPAVPTRRCSPRAIGRPGQAAEGFTIWKLAGQGNAKSMNLPALLLWHKGDTCADTRPAHIPAFRRWLEGGGAKVAVKEFSGGPPAQSDACESRAPHGFLGAEVVGATAEWIRQLP